MDGASFLISSGNVPFSAGGPTEQAQDAVPARTAQKNARNPTIGPNLRPTRPGLPQRRKREQVEAVSCCAEDAEPLRWRLQRARELSPSQESV